MKRVNRLLAMVLCIAMTFQMMAFEAVAQEISEAIGEIYTYANNKVIRSGYCGGENNGKNLSWTLTDNGVLTISGTGKMKDFDFYAPWDSNVDSVRSIVFAGSITSIGNCAFQWCQGLRSISIPNTVTSIGEYAFYTCTSLTSIVIPNGVTHIGSNAFGGCESLTSVTIPNGVEVIGDNAFDMCGQLTSVTIPESVTSIGANPFTHCDKLSYIFVNDKNTEYYSLDGVLLSKDKSKLICYPSGRKNISFSIPNSVVSICREAFSHCLNLTSITIPDSVVSIGDWAFKSCENLTSIELPDGIVAIGNGSFLGCEELTSIMIPKSVTSISVNPFSYCSKLISILVDDSNPEYFSKDGILFSKDGSRIICYPAGKLGNTYSIPHAILDINECAFSGCWRLTAITISDSVEFIDDRVFTGCWNLSDIYCVAESRPEKWSIRWNDDCKATIHWN